MRDHKSVSALYGVKKVKCVKNHKYTITLELKINTVLVKKYKTHERQTCSEIGS